MGFFDKKSYSTTTNTSQTSYSGAAGYGGVSVAGDSNQVVSNYSVLDGGAIDRAFDFGDNALVLSNNATQAAIDSANQSASTAALVSMSAMNTNSNLAAAAIGSGASLAGISMNNAAQLSGISMNTAAQLSGMSMNNSAAVAMGAMSAVEQAWNDSVSKALTFANVNATQAASATESALSFAETAARSDSADTMQALIKYASAAAAVVALFAMFRGRA